MLLFCVIIALGLLFSRWRPMARRGESAIAALMAGGTLTAFLAFGWIA